MRITKRVLRTIIAEEFARILEYEQYVDEDGNVYDDEGNVSRRGKAFGRRYGGQTYGLRGLPQGGGRSSRRKTSYVGADANAQQIAAVQAALDAKPNNFLTSILDQLKRGRGLSSKQKSIVKKILAKTDSEAAALFEAVINEGNADYLNGKHEDYKALVKDQQEPPYIREGKDMHRCMDGTMVEPHSQECYVDLLNRIEDAEYNRGHHSCGTEDRVYYNGLLKSLRRKRNRLNKTLEPLEVIIATE
tara:strand:- start:116 stop:853 length:738 start_codon:yes stop_codon:yes gene_type:complete